MTNSRWFLILGILVFGALLFLSVKYESPTYMYAASIIPIFIVPFIPDIKSNQYIKSKDHSFELRFYPADGLLSLDFDTDAVHWHKHILYFNLDQIAARPNHGDSGPFSAPLTVLAYDLVAHPRKKGVIGIRLGQLRERAQKLPYTIAEVNRLVIRMEDVLAAAKHQHAHGSMSASGKQIQA